MDRNTHEKVRKRALALIAEWAGEWEKDPTLGVMEECYTNLKSKGYKFDGSNEQPPPVEDDALRRREEEELQRVLEMSMQDKGGRNQWSEYSLASTSGAGASGASARPAGTSSSRPQPQSQAQPVYGGYVPSSSPALPSGNTSASVAAAAAPTTPSAAASYVPSSPVSSVKSQDSIPVVTRVRALHTFEPTEAGELAFEKGDIIKVVDRGYKDWWRGQLKGRTGIFPVNYVVCFPNTKSIRKRLTISTSGTSPRTHGCRTREGSRTRSCGILASGQCRQIIADAQADGSSQGQSSRQ